MKTTHILLAAVFAASSVIQATSAEHKLPAPMPEFKTPEQLTKWRAEKTNATLPTPNFALKNVSVFFTGKPYVEETNSYAFKYRNYDPELSRWTTADPSGFPDGANNGKYLANPTSALDYLGCFALSTTSPSVSDITDSATGNVHASAWDLQHVGAGSSAAGILQGLISGSSTLSANNLSGSVTVSSFYVQNHSSPQTGNNPNVASVNLTLQFQNAPSGFGWIQMQRIRVAGQSFSNWQLDISSGAGPAYTAGPVLSDTPAIGVFSQAPANDGDGGERQLYTFAATRDQGTWTIYDGIFWGGNVYE